MKTLLAALLILIFAFNSFALVEFNQSNFIKIANKSIAGTVTNKSHKFMANLKVKAINSLTKTHYQTKTNQSGYFAFTGLPPGTYTLIFETKNKFLPNRTAKVELGLNGGIIYNISLDIK